MAMRALARALAISIEPDELRRLMLLKPRSPTAMTVSRIIKVRVTTNAKPLIGCGADGVSRPQIDNGVTNESILEGTCYAA